MDLNNYIKNNKLHVIVKPNSSKTEVLEYNKEKDALKIAIKAIPDKNKANIALIKFISKELGKKVKIASGSKSKEKILEIY